MTFMYIIMYPLSFHIKLFKQLITYTVNVNTLSTCPSRDFLFQILKLTILWFCKYIHLVMLRSNVQVHTAVKCRMLCLIPRIILCVSSSFFLMIVVGGTD